MLTLDPKIRPPLDPEFAPAALWQRLRDDSIAVPGRATIHLTGIDGERSR